MSKLQIVIISTFVALFFIMYFGCETRSEEMLFAEQSRAIQMQNTSAFILIDEAKRTLDKSRLSSIVLLEKEIEEKELSNSDKIILFEQLMDLWEEEKFYTISGYYAQLIAESKNNEDLWGLSGSKYFEGAVHSDNEKTIRFSIDKAIMAFEKAISINPENIAHRINKALLHCQFPSKENPMKGILQMLDLNKKYPKNVDVLIHLARLSLQTDQVENAKKRYEQVINIEEGNSIAICSLVNIYKTLGLHRKSEEYEAKCKLFN